MPGIVLSLTPLTAEMHDLVVDLHAHWKRTPPDRMPPAAVVMTGDPPGHAFKNLVAAVYLYPAGPFLLMEFYVTNPAFPSRIRLAASVAGGGAALAIAASQGRLLLAAARTKGIERVLARVGFRDTRATLWACKVPPVPVWQDVAPPPGDAPPGGAMSITESDDASEEEPLAPPRVRPRKKAVKKKARRKVVGRRVKRSGLG